MLSQIDRELTEEDYIIVCGDFGYTMINKDDETFLNVLSRERYTVCFCDGNHENFSLLNSLKVEEWNGGKVHKLRKNVIHLMRGQTYELDGKRMFTFGGGFSIDRDKRVLNESYYLEEMPCREEYERGILSLDAVGYNVDYIITHTAPSSVVQEIVKLTGRNDRNGEEELRDYLEQVRKRTAYKRWFFGHWHIDKELENGIVAVYRKVHRVE